MTVPVVNVILNLSSGPSTAQTMILDTGLLDTNVLGDAVAIIVDVSDVVDSLAIQRGRNPNSDVFQAGTCTLRIVDQLGDFNPLNSLGPYFGNLDVMRKVQVTATYTDTVTLLSTTYDIYSGFIYSYATTTPKNVGEVVYTTITAIDGMSILNTAQISTVAGSGVQLSGARINAILDDIAWPNSMRDIDAGLQTLSADSGTARTALSACQLATASEFGSFYAAANGSFTFQDRDVTISSIGSTPVVFNDNGTDIPYFNALWTLNAQLVFNEANISIVGGAVQTASDAASIANYFLQSYNAQNLLMTTNADALNYAQALVASRANTTVRCDYLVLDLYYPNYNDGIIAAMELDFFDNVTITTTQPGASTLTKTLQVFGVAYDIGPQKFKVTFTTLEPMLDGFLLNDAIYGTLDTTTNVLSY